MSSTPDTLHPAVGWLSHTSAIIRIAGTTVLYFILRLIGAESASDSAWPARHAEGQALPKLFVCLASKTPSQAVLPGQTLDVHCASEQASDCLSSSILADTVDVDTITRNAWQNISDQRLGRLFLPVITCTQVLKVPSCQLLGTSVGTGLVAVGLERSALPVIVAVPYAIEDDRDITSTCRHRAWATLGTNKTAEAVAVVGGSLAWARLTINQTRIYFGAVLYRKGLHHSLFKPLAPYIWWTSLPCHGTTIVPRIHPDTEQFSSAWADGRVFASR